MSTSNVLQIEYGVPKPVDPRAIEAELNALRGEFGETRRSERALARTMTLAIYVEGQAPAEPINRLVAHVVAHNPARAVLIHAQPDAEPAGVDAWICTHCLTRGGETQLCCEQITLHARGEAVANLHAMVLRLRLSDLPLAVWWRGQPEFENRLFEELVKASDQIILDSARFTARAERVNQLIARLRREFTRVSFGDINWARLATWRELVAQFFDPPAHVDYLNYLNRISIGYAGGRGGNASKAILLLAWLGTQLEWRMVAGSYARDREHRTLRLRHDRRELQVEIRGRLTADAPPGELTDVALYAAADPPAAFEITRGAGDSVDLRVQIGQQVSARTARLASADEVALVCAELDAPQRDRLYHRALQFLEQLLAP